MGTGAMIRRRERSSRVPESVPRGVSRACTAADRVDWVANERLAAIEVAFAESLRAL